MTVEEATCSSTWTKDEDKAFENAIANYPDDTSNRWEKIVAEVPGKSLEEIKHHYNVLVDDVSRIESGCVPLPNYSNSWSDLPGHAGDEGTSKKRAQMAHHSGESHLGNKSSRSDQERRKGIAWTEDEHRLFLLGLDKYGKGDWRSISRNFVVTRTPTQVASHAQKYFIRLNSMNKDRRRSSIHDITSVNNADVTAQPPPITGHTNAAGASGKSPTRPPHHAAPHVYGTPTIGQPIGGPLVSAVGTPVYTVRAPVPGPVVSGAPLAPMTYPITPTSAHR